MASYQGFRLADAPDQQADSRDTVSAARKTDLHMLAQKTATDMAALEKADAEIPADADDDPLPSESGDTSFILNVPAQETAEVISASVVNGGPETFTITGVKQDESLSIDALKDSDAVPVFPGTQPEQPPVANLEQIKNREQFEQAKRELLLEDLRRAEEERKRREAEAAAAARRLDRETSKRAAKADDERNRFPLWKKGAAIAASVLILYWVGSVASGFVADIRRAIKPQTMPLAGKVVDGVGSQPLANAQLRFHPKNGAGTIAFAATTEDGTFKVSTFARDDGIVPGSYIVTINPGRHGTAYVPRSYQSVKTSPLSFEIGPGDDTLPLIKLQP